MSSVPYPTPEQVFQMKYESVRRDEVVGVLLAFFLGCFGIHHFYLNRVGMGILYCCFCWTGIPAILGVIECFFMPGRVRAYNAMQAAGLAAELGISMPGYFGHPGWIAPGYGYSQTPQISAFGDPNPSGSVLAACSQCQQTNSPSARYCIHCGTPLR